MSSKVYHLTTPVTQEQTASLRTGDVVYLNGTVFTMRDRAHEQLFAQADAGLKSPFDLVGAAVWHCGPVSRKADNGEWEITSMGQLLAIASPARPPACSRNSVPRY